MKNYPKIGIRPTIDGRQLNFIKFSVNQAFLSYFDFHLIDPSQACDVDTSKYWILQDMGHGAKSLRCLKN